MTTALWAIGLAAFSSIFSGFGPILIKKGVDHRGEILGFSFRALMTVFNANILFGVAAHLFGLALFTIALSGGDVSILYPIGALHYAFSSIFAATCW